MLLRHSTIIHWTEYLNVVVKIHKTHIKGAWSTCRIFYLSSVVTDPLSATEDVSRDRGRSSLHTTGTLTLKKLDLQRSAV